MKDSESPVQLPRLSSSEIVALRPNVARPEASTKPIDWMIEQEPSCPKGLPVECLTILLQGSECQFHCLMCDLWKSTHLGPTPASAIPKQIERVVEDVRASRGELPSWIKLYNASNFFASYNVPTQDLPVIAEMLNPFERVIVENHPRVLTTRIAQFQQQLSGQLEVAMGLETVHPRLLEALNKQMTLDDFEHACHFLTRAGIDQRAFVILRPPSLSESAGKEWCRRSVDFAESCGVRHCSIIPLRMGNGAMEHLSEQISLGCPTARSLEEVFVERLESDAEQVVTVDLWDWGKLEGLCEACQESRRDRLNYMNLHQCVQPAIYCSNCSLS